MAKVDWAIWANEHAVMSSIFLFFGAIVGVTGSFENWPFAAACIPASIIVFTIEYPRGKRAKGTTPERMFQDVIANVLVKFGILTQSYAIRVIMLVLICVPGCFLLPTLMGALCTMVSAAIYCVAAIKGEKWQPIKSKKSSKSNGEVKSTGFDPPSEPPPRPPSHYTRIIEEVDNNQRF